MYIRLANGPELDVGSDSREKGKGKSTCILKKYYKKGTVHEIEKQFKKNNIIIIIMKRGL